MLDSAYERLTPVQPEESRRTLRVCHLIGHVNFGGAERQVVNLINALHSLCPVLLLTDRDADNQLLPEIHKDVQVIRIPCRRSSFVIDVMRLARELRRLEIDVLHTHMFWPSLYGAMAAWLAGVPVMVTTEHGLNPWKRAWHRWCERHVISAVASRRICVSEEILRNRLERDLLPAEQLKLVPNGTQIRAVVEKAMSAPPRLLSVGRLVPPKDYANLLRAVRGLLDSGVEVVLQVAGDGPLRESLAEQIQALGLDSRVTLLGSRQDVSALMDMSDIFVISSSREGQPLVLLEAMAASMPIVTTGVGGIPQTVDHEREALVVPADNPQAISAAIARLIREPSLREALGRQARRRATSQFSITAVAARHLELYQELVAQSPRKAAWTSH